MRVRLVSGKEGTVAGEDHITIKEHLIDFYNMMNLTCTGMTQAVLRQ